MKILNKLTLNYLKMNRKRTLVTIIGIVLTGAMIAGITTLTASFQNFMVESERQVTGNYEARYNNIEYKNVEYIENNQNFKNVFLTSDLGGAKNPGIDKKYIEIYSYDEKALNSLNVRLVEGVLPKSSDEILISESFYLNHANKEVKIGDSITLETGKRMLENDDGSIIEQYYPADYTDGEWFEISGEKTYKLVGIIKSPKFEYDGSMCAGAITFLDRNILAKTDIVTTYLSDKVMKNIYEDTENAAKALELFADAEEMDAGISYNKYLLAYSGVSNADGVMSTMYMVMVVLIIVVAACSVVVIYNSFAISVSERKKQFGMLSSIGATKKQIRKMVLFEGIVLSIICIPLGILAGILGIWGTLGVVNPLIKSLFTEGFESLNLTLAVSYPSLIIAAVSIFITVIISVIIPAWRASRISPIDAIRQSDDVKVKAKKLRTPKFFRKIFGVEGEIALKNLKRCKKRYRTTVISLVISIVLFLTFTGFVSYMFDGFDALYVTMPYDYAMQMSSGDNLDKIDQIVEKVKQKDSSDKVVSQLLVTGGTFIKEENMASDLLNLRKDDKSLQEVYEILNGKSYVGVEVISLDDEEYARYSKEIGLSNLEDGKCIVCNYVDGLITFKKQFNLTNYKVGDKFEISRPISSNNEYEVAPEDKYTVEVAKVTDILPYGTINPYGSLYIVVNENTMKEFCDKTETVVEAMTMIETDNLLTLKDDVAEIVDEYPEVSFYNQSVKETMEMLRNLKLVIEIFLYGFIVLISLIGVSNIFNTISTNVNLRRREFANLKSMGMTDGGFNKMLNLECFFYGTKALLIGLPIGVVVGYLLNRAFSEVLVYSFTIPFKEILICAVAVYFVVFITMIYSTAKVKKENIIDVLRDDNV